MKIALGIVLFSVASGCWGADPATDESVPEPLAPAGATSASPTAARKELEKAGGVQTTCRALMLRQRACSAQFIPALVDARVERDEPPGTAAHARDIGRDALVAEALDEWALDSRDEAIDSTCVEIARFIAPGRVQELESSASACLERAGCDAFVACVVPVNLGHWKE